MRTARDAVQAANPAAKIEIRCVDVYPITVSVAVVKDGQEVCFFFQTTHVTKSIPLAKSALLLLCPERSARTDICAAQTVIFECSQKNLFRKNADMRERSIQEIKQAVAKVV